MHEVGRRYGAEHHVTLGDLMRFIPQSNDPTCSAGFGMGLVMYLGPQIIVSGGRSALSQCMRLPTRYRSYTCVHGIGHALMRAYHGHLRQTVVACRKLGAQAPDCAQGAFHDYWISLRGADGTTLRANGAKPQFLCNGHLWYVRPCWYRYFVEQASGSVIDSPRQCAPRAGVFARSSATAASAAPRCPSPRARSSRRGSVRACRADAAACLRGVAVQAFERNAKGQRALFALCGRWRRASGRIAGAGSAARWRS